jgi:uncharacterized protein YbcV (DUF1398 family)
MDEQTKAVAELCIRGSEDDSLNFPIQLARLAQVGFEGYYTDFRRSARVFYRPDGESLELATAPVDVPVSLSFDALSVGAAVRQSQAGTHTYRDFCRKVVSAGCAGYLVSIPGRRVVYFGRTGETHVEHFSAAS